MLATTVDFLKESGPVFLIMTGPPLRYHPCAPKAMQAWLGEREHRVRVAPAAQPLSKKISQSPPHLRPGEQSFSAGL